MSELAWNPEHPENLPEIPREITMILGALQGLDRAWDDLVGKVGPIRLQRPEIVDDKVAPMRDAMAVYSPTGKQLREVYEIISRKEAQVYNLISELGV